MFHLYDCNVLWFICWSETQEPLCLSGETTIFRHDSFCSNSTLTTWVKQTVSLCRQKFLDSSTIQSHRKPPPFMGSFDLKIIKNESSVFSFAIPIKKKIKIFIVFHLRLQLKLSIYNFKCFPIWTQWIRVQEICDTKRKVIRKYFYLFFNQSGR